MEFSHFIESLVSKFNLPAKISRCLRSQRALSLYKDAFTVGDYEALEQLGDATVNKFIVQYSYRTFPFLNTKEGVKIVARIRIKYASSQVLAALADDLNFWTKISLGPEEGIDISTHRKRAIMEDVFEAYLGATELVLDSEFGCGVGYITCYQILKQLYDKLKIDISYENLFDAKTRLKEMCDFYKNLSVSYKTEKVSVDVLRSIITYKTGTMERSIESAARTKTDAEQCAANLALLDLNKHGFIKPIPDVFNKIEQHI
jgi:dsRNA-specific ribonuclease